MNDLITHLLSLKALLVQQGRPAIETVPVSERMPGPEDCDSEGKCWWFSGWVTKFWNYHKPRDRAISQTHWLPYHALPLPAK